jgi:hypothetical protein
MNSIKFLSKPSRSLALLGVLAAFSASIHAQSNSAVRAPADEHEEPKSQLSVASSRVSLSKVRYLGLASYRMSNGRSEAVIVPALGRVMRYAPVGGANLLWNSAPGETKPGEWRNWGGDKSWPAPQSQWPLSIGREWPPHPSWDGQAYVATVLLPSRLRITSGVWPHFGCRVIRDFSFDAGGDFVISQTYEKSSGPPVELAIWTITQVADPDAIFIPVDPQSAYKNGFHWLTKPEKPPEVALPGPDLLRVRSNDASANKIGVDAPLATVVTVKGGVAFRQQAERPAGNYPDGARGNGFPIEVFDIGGTGDSHYMETELLSPLRLFYAHSRWTHSVRWSVHTLSSQHIDSSECVAEIRTLMRVP